MRRVLDSVLSSSKDQRAALRRRLRFACKLVENGKVAGVTETEVVVQMEFNGNCSIWRVVGGDVQHPSLHIQPDLAPGDVFWLTERK